MTQNTSILLFFMPQTHGLAQFGGIKSDYSKAHNKKWEKTKPKAASVFS